MAKHLLLASGIKSLTGNVEIVHILNRLGHSISYSSMLEIDTAIAMQRQESSNYLIPDCVNPYIFTTIAWDNIDKCEETLTGAGSTHRVNGIVIQKPLIGPQVFNEKKIIARTRQRSISVLDLPLPTYASADRNGPGLCHTSVKNYDRETKSI